MDNRKSRFAATIGGVFVAMLTLTALSGSTARAEDYCDTWNIGYSNPSDGAATEKQVREKCKVGDIITILYARSIGRLCDLHQPVITGDHVVVCFLAPPRKTY